MTEEDRVAVKTYVPASQKTEWREHADDLDMSQSEFLRSMVQAGRRGFLTNSEEGGSTDATPGGSNLEDRVLDALGPEDATSWDQLVEELSGDFEDRLEEAIQSLHQQDRIRHEPRRGGYVRRGEP